MDTQEYEAGFDAGRTGISWKANPHPTLSRQNREWADGHLEGANAAVCERAAARRAASANVEA